MEKGNGKFDFNKLVKFPMLSRDNEGMKVDFRHSEDYRTIAIKPEQEGDFRIPKVGTMKYKE